MKMNSCGSRGDNDVLFLPDDIMVAILVRLPPSSLLLLKLVCKSWRDLIIHPDFIQMHLDHSNKKPLLLISGVNFDVERYDHNLRLEDFHRLKKADQMKRYWGSCNGLICAMIKKSLIVWNPCTFEYDTVDLDWAGVFGFGYDSTTDSYKIIHIKLFHRGCARRRQLIQAQVWVYTLGATKSWESLGSVPFEVSPEHAGLFINGGLHWVATTECGIGIIIRIDIASEEYREISKPDSVSINRDDTMDDNGNVKLIELKGFLCITNYVTKEKSIDVWALKDYFNGFDEPSSWSKLCRIQEPLMAIPYPGPGLKYFQPLSGICSKDGDEIVAVVDNPNEETRSLVWYNMKHDKTRIILENRDCERFNFQVQTCIESLVPLNTGYYNMMDAEEMLEEEYEKIRQEEERRRILRPRKKQKKYTCMCNSNCGCQDVVFCKFVKLSEDCSSWHNSY